MLPELHPNHEMGKRAPRSRFPSLRRPQHRMRLWAIDASCKSRLVCAHVCVEERVQNQSRPLRPVADGCKLPVASRRLLAALPMSYLRGALFAMRDDVGRIEYGVLG